MIFRKTGKQRKMWRKKNAQCKYRTWVARACAHMRLGKYVFGSVGMLLGRSIGQSVCLSVYPFFRSCPNVFLSFCRSVCMRMNGRMWLHDWSLHATELDAGASELGSDASTNLWICLSMYWCINVTALLFTSAYMRTCYRILIQQRRHLTHHWPWCSFVAASSCPQALVTTSCQIEETDLYGGRT